MRRSAWIIIIVLALVLALLLAFWVLPRSFKQADIRAAVADIALLETEDPAPQPEARNLFSALWLLPYNVAAEEEAALMREYGEALMYSHDVPAALAARRWDEEALQKLACSSHEQEACLEDIRQRLPEYQRLLQQYRPLIEHIDALADAEILYSGDWLKRADMSQDPIPSYQYLFFGRNAAMAEYLGGDTASALQRSCRQIKLGRTLAAQGDNLITAMIGNALMDRNLSWLAQMLAEQPQWSHKLPESCGAVLNTPVAAESLTLCRSMKGEYRLMTTLLTGWDGQDNDWAEQVGVKQAGRLERWLNIAWDAEHSKALGARRFAAYCGPKVHAWAAQDAADKVSLPPTAWRTRWACLHNIVGCSAFLSDDTNYDDYRLRLADTEMRRRAVQAAVAVHRLPENADTAAIEAVLAPYHSPSRRLQWDGQTASIRYPVYSAAQQGKNSIPLRLPRQP